MIKQYKIPTIIGLLILIIGVAAGIFLVQTTQILRPAASPEETPKNVRITNITDRSFTVSWVTDKATTGFVSYGTSQNLGQTESRDKQVPTSLHHITITGLAPSTDYFFKIASQGRLFDNKGRPFQTKTAPSPVRTPTADVIFGKVKNQSGLPETETIVYVNFSGASPLSTTTDKDGQWTLNLGEARSTNLVNFADYDASTILEIFIQGTKNQFATARVRIETAKPVPDIVLGKTYDFTQLAPLQPGQVPQSTLELPQQEAPSFPTEPVATETTQTSPTPTPLFSPKPVGGLSSPSPSPSPKLSPTPRVAIPSTESGIPVSGDLTTTLMLSIMGIVFIFTGLVIPRLIKN
jgi:hypothetical protein